MSEELIIVPVLMFGLMLVSTSLLIAFKESIIARVFFGLTTAYSFPLGFSIASIMVEGGSTLAAAFEADVVRLLQTMYMVTLQGANFLLVLSLIAALFIGLRTITDKRGRDERLREDTELY